MIRCGMIIVVSIAVALSGCGGDGSDFDPSEFRQVKVGMTKEQVEEVLGEPTERLGPEVDGTTLPQSIPDSFPGEHWYYRIDPDRDPTWAVSFRGGRVVGKSEPTEKKS